MQQNAVRSTQQILTLQQLLLLFDICSSSTYCSCYFDIVVSKISNWYAHHVHVCVRSYIMEQPLPACRSSTVYRFTTKPQTAAAVLLLLIFGIIIVYLGGSGQAV